MSFSKSLQIHTDTIQFSLQTKLSLFPPKVSVCIQCINEICNEMNQENQENKESCIQSISVYLQILLDTLYLSSLFSISK